MTKSRGGNLERHQPVIAADAVLLVHHQVAEIEARHLGDEMVEKAVNIVVSAAKTGKIGDGKVFVLPVEHAVRIRTEEIGEKAV